MQLKKVWQLAWPVMLSNITIPLLGMIDIIVVGHDHPPHILGAVAIGAMIFDVLFLLFGFLRMSTTGLVAQSPKEISIFLRAIFSALFIALILLTSQTLIFKTLCFVIKPEAMVMQSLCDYFYLRIYAAPTTLSNFVIFGYFFGRQNTKVPLFLLLLINISAISLDLIFVRYYNFSIKGLAAANIIAQTLGFTMGLIILYKLYIAHRASNFKHKIENLKLFDQQEIKRLFHLNKDIFIRTLCLMATFTYFTCAGNHLGTTIVAANAILLSMHQFTACGLDGFAIACEVMVGKAIGKKNNEDFKGAIKSCAYCSLVIAFLLSAIYFFAGPQIIGLMTSLPKITKTAQDHLIWMVFLPILSMAGFLLDGIFIGATWSKPMRNTMLCATLLIYFPSVLLFKPLGNNGLWLAFSLFMLARGLLLGFILLKKWRNNMILGIASNKEAL